MGLFSHLLLGLSYFAAIGLDILFFFVLVRLLAVRWPCSFLINLDRVGTPVIEPPLVCLGRILQFTSAKVRLFILTGALTACRFGLAAIVKSLG